VEAKRSIASSGLFPRGKETRAIGAWRRPFLRATVTREVRKKVLSKITDMLLRLHRAET
jgi:hypothetical protein